MLEFFLLPFQIMYFIIMINPYVMVPITIYLLIEIHNFIMGRELDTIRIYKKLFLKSELNEEDNK